MNLFRSKNTTPITTNSVKVSPLQRTFLLVALALALFALSSAPNAFAVTPAPDGGYPNNNTAEGTNALRSVSGFGADDTAVGFGALQSNPGGIENTAIGSGALQSNTNGPGNTAIGFQALFNIDSASNTATGVYALFRNTNGEGNAATGQYALQYNTTGNANTATGSEALSYFNTGDYNTATGWSALSLNTTGNNNTASGADALFVNETGNNNTAEGFQALYNNSTGSNNIALGTNAGINLTTGNNNIVIGAPGAGGDSNAIIIGTVGVQKSAYIRGISGATVTSGVTVIVDTKGHLGTVQSSARYKEAIKPMDKASEAILALKPVTFRYKHELDPEGIPQFGLVAEQVEKVNPDLVARDENGQAYTVRYEAVNVMLLNEFLKEHRKVEEQEARLAKQESTIIQRQKQIEALTTGLQKVSNQFELNRTASQIVSNNP